MNDREMIARLNQARDFEHTIGKVTFGLRVPTRSELRVTVVKHGGHLSSAGDVMASNAAIVQQSLLWARGATTADVGLPGDPAPLPETSAGAWAYVSEHPDVLDALREALTDKTVARFDAIEADEKN